MTRACDVCGKPYEAKRASSRYCSSSCRARKAQGAQVLPIAEKPASQSEGLVAATRRDLEEASRLDTALGQGALLLARRLENERDTGSGAAALTREWRATLAEAVKGSGVQASPLDKARDELARRRAARGA